MATTVITHQAKNFEDLTGGQFGRWTVMKYVGHSRSKQSHFLCKCSCGTNRIVRGTSLKLGSRRGGTVSCGCHLVEIMTTHGQTSRGRTQPRTYRIWANMLKRCRNHNSPDFSDYGGRGIKVCDRWSDYSKFIEDVGECPPQHSIDRFPDNDGNYEPGNVRWATLKQQARNKRNNRMLEYDGRSQCVAAWAEECGLRARTIVHRLAIGWSVTDALTKSVRNRA